MNILIFIIGFPFGVGLILALWDWHDKRRGRRCRRDGVYGDWRDRPGNYGE